MNLKQLEMNLEAMNLNLQHSILQISNFLYTRQLQTAYALLSILSA